VIHHYRMAASTKLVFYDLEWSQSEIIQIGAECEGKVFSQCVRPTGKVDWYVSKKIKLEVRPGPTGERQVFDTLRKVFLPTVEPRLGFERFLSWLEEIAGDAKLILISHGAADIQVLDRNLCNHDLDHRLYRSVGKYVNFQEYIATHFKDISPKMSLKHLVEIYCKDWEFRLHCADEDSQALSQVFYNLHQMRGIRRPEFLNNLVKMRKIYFKSIIVPKSCREIRELASKLNPASDYILLPNIFGVYNIFASSPLFSVIEQPEQFEFEVPGYVVRHAQDRYQVRDEQKERTKLELVCHVGNAFFKQTQFLSASTKSPHNLVCKIGETVKLIPGTPVNCILLVTSTNFVKVSKVTEDDKKKWVDIEKKIEELRKVKSGERLDPDTEKVEEVHEECLDRNGNRGKVWRGAEQLQRPGQYSGGQGGPGQERETDLNILSRRQKQLEYCKNTDDYQAYASAVPRSERKPHQPRTPDLGGKYSRRQWDGAVKHWKTAVHAVGRQVGRQQQHDAETRQQHTLKQEGAGQGAGPGRAPVTRAALHSQT